LADRLCRGLALAAWRGTQPRARAAGLVLFTALPDREKGHLAAELSRAAAEAAALAGAPAFAGNALAAAVPAVAPEDLEQHLLRAAELFAEADQSARLGGRLEFARLELSEARLRTPRWAALASRAAMAAEERPADAKPDETAVAAELKTARAAAERSRKQGGAR